MRRLIASLALATILVAAGTMDDDSIGGVDLVTDEDEIRIEETRETDDDSHTTPVHNDNDRGKIGEWLAPTEEFTQCLNEWDDGRGCFMPIEDADPAEDAVEIPPVTITDVAHFAPDGVVLAGEPENVGVAGLPTNFVAEASVHTVDGELFGFPVIVRFTPVAFDFTFGDGESLTTTSGGALWAELDQAQFTPTATSHTYSDRGTYAASVNVRYTAEVDFGIGWFPISGEVTATGPAQEIRIYEAHTALVAYTCDEAPTSPGC